MNFAGVFPLNNFQNFTKSKISNCPFLVFNTARSDKPGTHWCRILDLHLKKKIFLLNSLGVSGFKDFIIQGNAKLVNKILFCLKKFKFTDNKLTLVRITFLLEDPIQKVEAGTSDVL